LDLLTDPRRIGRYQETTGISVRARGPTGIDTFDLAELTRESVISWLRSRGGENLWAEDVALILMGHGPMHYPKDDFEVIHSR
jgi:hypothetical protein